MKLEHAQTSDLRFDLLENGPDTRIKRTNPVECTKSTKSGILVVVFRGLDEERGVRGDSHNSDSRDKLINTATHGMRTYRT